MFQEGPLLYPVRAAAHKRFHKPHPIERQPRRIHPSVRRLSGQEGPVRRY
jgi:hypothetical protein